MYQNDKEFKRVALRTGISLLCFFALFYSFFSVYYLISDYIQTVFEGVLGHTVSEILYGLTYLSAFIIPALLFRLLGRKDEIHPQKLFKAPPKTTPLIVLASVAICLACAYVNSYLVSFFEVSDSLTEGLLNTPMGLREILLLTFTSAVVPAICEEYLFRHTLLARLLPFGESFAIISTAIFFGLMHQNIAQIFYTTMAGIAIGYAYAKTRSFLCVFLIHFTNNFTSVIQQAISANMSDPLASVLVMLINAAVLLGGMASLIALIIKDKNRKDIYSTGSFEIIFEPSPNYKQKPVSFEAPTKLFTTPTVLIYIIICIITCILPLVML